MRVFIGGVIGTALAAAGWLSLEHFAHINYGWLVCLVGLGAGIGIRKASKASNTGSSLRGALAIILALAGIFLGRQAYTQIVKATLAAEAEATVTQVAANASANDAEDKSESAEAGEGSPELDADLSSAVMVKDPAELAGYKNRTLKGTLSESDMLWMCLSGLLAYVLGKHDGVPGTAEVPEGESTDEPSGSTNDSGDA